MYTYDPLNLPYSNIVTFCAYRNGVYPLTAFALMTLTQMRPRAVTPELAESVKSETPEPVDTENRMVVNMVCHIKKPENSENLQVIYCVSLPRNERGFPRSG